MATNVSAVMPNMVSTARTDVVIGSMTTNVPTTEPQVVTPVMPITDGNTNTVTQAMSWAMIQSVMIGRVSEPEIMVVVPVVRESSYADEPGTVIIRRITGVVVYGSGVGRPHRIRGVRILQQVSDDFFTDSGFAQP